MTDQTKLLYATRVLTAASGCEAGTFNKWRSRNGLLPREESGWLFWSFADICTARMVVVLTHHGMSAFQSIAVVNNLICFEALTAWSSQLEPGFLVIINRDGETSLKKCLTEKLIRILQNEPDEVLTVVSIGKIIAHCRERLDQFDSHLPDGRLYPCQVVEDGTERTEYLPMQHRPAAVKHVPDTE